ncbi:MAG: hypothetical protein IPN42_13925 [Methylococcaceae bacterium]|nr:hypothetical protein [Methylococcaceae bacterium]
MGFYNKNRLSDLLPWGITLAVLAAFAFYGIYYQPKHNPFQSQAHKIDLISSMRIHLLEAIEAEKNAVLAIDDEESKGYATKAQQAADEVEKIRKYIEPIIQQDGTQSESNSSMNLIPVGCNSENLTRPLKSGDPKHECKSWKNFHSLWQPVHSKP